MACRKLCARGEEPVPCLLNHYRGHKGPILSLIFHPNLQEVFSAGADGFIMCWKFKKDTRALRFEGHCGPVNEISLSKYGDLLLSASDDHTVRVWVPVINGQYITIKGHHGAVRTCAFNSVDPTIFATGSNDKTVKVWSVQAAKMKSGATKFKSYDFLMSFRSHTNWVRSVRFSNDGRLLCSASDDKTVKVYDIRCKTLVASINCDLGSPLRADFNPCGSLYVGVASSENAFLMYDVQENKLIQSYVDLFGKATTFFSFHPSGDFAVCVSEDAKIKILDLIEGRPIFTLHGPRKGLCATAFNSEGTLFATGGKDAEVLIWEPVLIPYKSIAEEGKEGSNENNTTSEETTEKENVLPNAGGSKGSSSTSADNKGTSKRRISQSSIVASNSKSVLLSSLSRTPSATASEKSHKSNSVASVPSNSASPSTST